MLRKISGGGTNAEVTKNKSYVRTDIYDTEYVESSDKIFNFTIDDTIDCFADISDGAYDSIFENYFFEYLRNVHNKYGITVTCYVFYESGDFNLSMCTDKYREEFERNADWLRFGFHSLNGETSYENKYIIDDYEKTISELSRIVGNNAIDNVIRLQSFKGGKRQVQALQRSNIESVKALLTSDDNRISYCLDDEENSYIYSHDRYQNEDMCYISTDLRLEYINDICNKINEFRTSSWCNQLDYLVVFTHEKRLDASNKDKLEKICEYAMDNGYDFVFLEDVLP